MITDIFRRGYFHKNMDIKDIQNAGSEILGAVTDAVERGDYSELSGRINRTVGNFTKEIERTVNNYTDKVKYDNTSFRNGRGTWTKSDTVPSNRADYAPRSRNVDVNRQNYLTKNNLFYDVHPVTPYFRQGKLLNKFYGLGWIAGGILGSLFSGSFAVLFLIIGLITWNAGMFFGTLAFTAGLVINVLLCKKGTNLSRLYKRYVRYGNVIGDAEYIELKKLDRLSLENKETIIKDIEYLREKGTLPNARFDNKRTTLILTDRAYENYIEAENARILREEEEERENNKLNESVYGEQVRQILSQGNQYLEEVRTLNDKIPDEQMSGKISRIENLMAKTFEELKNKPSCAPDLRKFMSYYLPTTIKLLKAYAELDTKPGIGSNIIETKKQISESLDMVGNGFEKLFDSLFEDMSIDISSDISVMKTMMAQDGLSD